MKLNGKMMANKHYDEWILQVIECICNERRITASAKIAEIKCVLRRDGHYPESYAAGDTPEEAWHDELEAMMAHTHQP